MTRGLQEPPCCPREPGAIPQPLGRDSPLHCPCAIVLGGGAVSQYPSHALAHHEAI